MKDLLMIGAFVFAWIALNRWVLPALGIQTCMSGGCCGDSCRPPARQTAPLIEDNKPQIPENTVPVDSAN